jgi:hypothetical protein
MRKPCEISIEALGGLAAPGDLLLYRDAHSIEDVLIGRGGRSPYAHAGMLGRWHDRWIVMEMIQWHGGRWRYLEDAVRDDDGHWDVFLSNAGNRWQWDRGAAIRRMWSFIGRPYGWAHVIWVALLKLPLLRALVPAVTADPDADCHSPFCSEAVSIATRLAGVAPVALLPDQLTEPGDLARSLFYEYALTLAKP